MAFLQMLGIFAEFETALRKERQTAGIAKVMTRVYKGRKPSLKDAQMADIRTKSKAGMKPITLDKFTHRKLSLGAEQVQF